MKSKQKDGIKRTIDIFLSLIVLILFFPFSLIIALIIMLDDPKGAPLFHQTRIGKDGKPFQLYKFRTMKVNAEDELKNLLDKNEADGPVFKIKNDPRITKFGSFLRKTGIDEVPQFYNVLKGEMSIVGPRPPLPREVEKYTPEQAQRLSVKPGITCIWQIQPDRNSIPFNEWVDMDLEYIKNRSTLLDLKLMLKTAGVMLKAQGH